MADVLDVQGVSIGIDAVENTPRPNSGAWRSGTARAPPGDAADGHRRTGTHHDRRRVSRSGYRVGKICEIRIPVLVWFH